MAGKMTRQIQLAAMLVTWLTLASFSLADGFIIIHEAPARPDHFSFAPLEVTYHHVTVKIDDLVAVTTVDQEFYNPNGLQLEGTYMFPLPSGAHIDKFSMDINGKMMEAELLPADKARSIYEEIVRKYRDPALLEYAGRDAFKVRIFPIEPNSRKKVTITYTQLLKSDTGLVEYAYPLNTEKFSSRPLGDVSVKVELNCKDPLKSVYCPSHNVEIKRDGDRRAVVGYEEKNVRPDTDFKLMFSRTEKPISMDLLTYRAPGSENGYFMLLASPGMDLPAGTKVQARDICFVLDTSGSMAGPKMEQAKKAMLFCLANLNPEDKFEIVRFSTEAEKFFGELKPATKENVDKAQAFVAGLKPIGGTAIGDALQQALSLATPIGPALASRPSRPYVVIFLTDGQPTVGETNEDKLVATFSNPALMVIKPRIFSFGIGTDINTHLLDRISNDTKAFSQYVLPAEDIEVKVSNFYTKIKEPVLSNVQLTITGEGIKTTQVYPSAMPDLFKGEMLVAFGRYTGKGPGAVRVGGTLNEAGREFTQDVTFAENDTTNAFIPRLWATRRVGFLLDEIRLHGESAELKDEVTQLARAHGIVTPYTAYLILEDEAKRNVPLTQRSFREMEDDAMVRGQVKEQYDSARAETAEKSGERAVANSGAMDQLKQSTNEQQAAAPMGMDKDGAGKGIGGNGAATTQPSGYKVAQNYAQQARVVNGRAFYQNGKTWTDSTAQSQQNLKQQEVKFNSDDYFALLAAHPEAAQWLALGEEVDIVIGDTLYVIRGS